MILTIQTALHPLTPGNATMFALFALATVLSLILVVTASPKCR
jgi:hypothetical protein